MSGARRCPRSLVCKAHFASCVLASLAPRPSYRLSSTVANLDQKLLLLARTCGHTPTRERAVARFSRLGEHGGVWLAIGTAGGLLNPARRVGWRRARRAVVGAYVLNTAIKPIAGRRRPQPAGLPALTGTPTGLSFPSAHASTSFAGALAYSRMGLPAPAVYALASGLALSRLYLGVHHPSDVIAGAALGTVVAGALTGRVRTADGSLDVAPDAEPFAAQDGR